MFVWEKAQSSGGCQLYKRVKVDCKYNEVTFNDFKSHQRLHNAFANEWDLCKDFCFSSIDNDSDSDCKYNSDGGYYDNSYPQEFVSQPQPLPAPVEADVPMDFESDQSLSVLPYCTDPLKAMALVYSYLPCMGPTNHLSTHSWDSVLGFLGFVTGQNFWRLQQVRKME